MNKYFKIALVFLRIWIVASIINAALIAIVISVVEMSPSVFGMAVLFFFFSLIFSAPFVGSCWLLAMMACSNTYNGEKIYRVVFNSSFFLSIAAAIFFNKFFGNDFKNEGIAIGFCIVIAALSSVTIFRKKIKAIEQNNQP